MKSPQDQQHYRIALICEGQEELMYFYALMDLGVFNQIYEIEPILATNGNDDRVGGAGNIPAFFQDCLTKPYDAVFFVLDVDSWPHEAFEAVKKKISLIVGPAMFHRFALFTNPCTLQLMVLHFEKTILSTQSKVANSGIIQRIWPKIKKYDAKKWQLDEIKYSFNKENYETMKANAKSLLGKTSNECPSTNIVDFFENLESPNPAWLRNNIQAIKK